MKLKNICLLSIGLFLIFITPISVSAYDLPSVNLGFTSFMDGAPPSGPGLYSQEYVQFWTADKFTNNTGSESFPPGTGEKLDAWIILNQVTYQSNTELMLGAKWGLDVIIPVVSLDMSYDNYQTGFPLENSGIGDIWVGPYLQWDPVMGDNGPKFMHRFSLGFIFPTGSYDENKAINAGSNFFSFNPYWAATYFVTPKLTISTRIHYLWNAENDDTDIKAGQAIHLNFASSYELIPSRLRVGINGFYLKQISDSEQLGTKVSGVREKVFAIGPGMLYSFNKDAHLFINTYFESAAENRPEGTRINLRFVYHF